MADVEYGLPTTDRASFGLESYSSGRNTFVLTAAMTTTAQGVKSGPGRLGRIVNTQLGSASVEVYDAIDPSATGSAPILFKGTLGATAATCWVDLQLPFYAGLVVVATSTVANDVRFTWI